MNKKFFSIILIICIVCSSFILARGNDAFDITTYNFKIYYNGKKLSFDSPVLLINGQTYVPLRDFAEEADMNVEWNGETKEIMLTERLLDVKGIFANIFGFNLPQTAQILNYNYVVEGRDERLLAKIFFEESDLEYIKEGLDIRSDLLLPDEFEDEYYIDEYYIYVLSTKYNWWDISSTKEALYTYFGFIDGVDNPSMDIWGLICKDNDSDGYYLYIYS